MRIVRKYNDALTAASLIASLVASAAFVAFIVYADSHIIKIWSTSLALVAIFGCFVLTFRLMIPREFELTIDPEEIRFGMAGRSSVHRSILRSSVRCVIFNTEDGSLCIDSGGWIALSLAPEILWNEARMSLVVDYIKSNWKDVPVVNQYEYQEMCRAK